ncbi:MAG: 50S ribosomal protein L15 [archaeon]|nr:50S ribosomal protein L15 [archaeon]
MPSRTKKFRGLRTHGRGKKSGRGAGIIGGHGNAGLGKTKKIRTLKYDRYHFGRYGFKRPQQATYAANILNVNEIEEKIDTLISSGFAKKDGDVYNVDLTSAGIDKLLGTGNISIRANITVADISASALKKIQAVGGSVLGFETDVKE